MNNPRYIATKILLQVITERRSLTTALLTAKLDNTQANLVKELCFGVCRWYFRLQALTARLLAKPLRDKDQDIQIALLIGLYQILYLRIPDHAAVVETVDVARALKKPWATKLMNGVLRSFLRQREALLALVDYTLPERYSHPKWLVDAIQAAWPSEAEAILQANNQHPPLCLRINRLKISRDDYLKTLARQDITAQPILDVPYGILLEKAREITELPGFNQGHFFVQDSSAQFAANLLQLAPKQRVLDACAAPGGKTTHILETEPQLSTLVAVDHDPQRLEKVRQNVQRLGLTTAITWITADASLPATWWDGQPFDRILLDAPCSGTGVIRRHPDIKLLRTPEDITSLAQQQQALLEALWPLLKPDGLLVYATCSIFPAENQQVVQAFLQRHPEAVEKEIVADWGIATHPGRQILPGADNGDGFYYAVLGKK